MSSEGILLNDFKYLSYCSEKHSSFFTEQQLAEKCLSALLFTAKKYVASMKFSLFQENFIGIYQSHPDGLKVIHHELQVQMERRLKAIMLQSFLKYDIPSQLSLHDNTIVDKNALNKENKSTCPLALKSTNCSSYPPKKNLIKLKIQRTSRNEGLGTKHEQAMKKSKHSIGVVRHGIILDNQQAHLKHPTYFINNKQSSSCLRISKEKQRLNFVLSELHSCNEEKENMIFRTHEGILSLGNRIQYLNKKVMLELDKLYERHTQTT